MIDRYSRPEMAAIWTLENRYRNWFKVEQAVCQAWNEQGVIPDEDLKNIMVDMDFDIDRILEIEQTTRHDVIAFLTYLEEKIGPSARFIHLGCTSSDMVDTGMALHTNTFIVKNLRFISFPFLLAPSRSQPVRKYSYCLVYPQLPLSSSQFSL